MTFPHLSETSTRRESWHLCAPDHSRRPQSESNWAHPRNASSARTYFWTLMGAQNENRCAASEIDLAFSIWETVPKICIRWGELSSRTDVARWEVSQATATEHAEQRPQRDMVHYCPSGIAFEGWQ